MPNETGGAFPAWQERGDPNPGTDDARKAGCLCPIIDNHYGMGARLDMETGNPLFWIVDGCPLHAPPPAPGKGGDSDVG